MRDASLDCLFEPLEMPNLKLKNRFYMAPMGTGYDTERLVHYLSARSLGGVAMITTEETSVHPGGRAGLTNELLIESDSDIPKLSKIAKAIHSGGAKAVIQLNHAGRYSPGRCVGGRSVAPSAIMSGYTGETPRALSTGEVDDLVISFANAAVRAREAGFDGVEFMGSSGYLISEFLSPLTNKREDKYGGDVAGRSAFIISVLKESRMLLGPDFNICVKFDADDGMNGGITLEQSMVFAPELAGAGADRLHVWAGWHESSRPMLPMFVPRAAFTYLAAAIKKTVSVPVSTVGRINDPATAASVLAKGEADLIGLGRALLADPDFVNKAREGRLREIRRCTACCHCFDRIILSTKKGEPSAIFCALNPEAGREGEDMVKKAKNIRHVAVIGAGPAGLEAARVASLRGHKVTLYDRDDSIGGMVRLSFVPPHKEELKGIVEYYSEEMKLLQVDMKLSTGFDTAEMEKIMPDVFVIATGAGISVPDIPGSKENNVVTAFDILGGKCEAGLTVAVIGGGMIGLETAEYLTDKGRKVTVVEMDRVASDMGPTSRGGFIARLRRKVAILTSTKVIEIRKNGILVIDRSGKERNIPADTVVLATGLESRRDMEEMIALRGIKHYVVGSARKPGLIDEAISDGFNAGCAI